MSRALTFSALVALTAAAGWDDTAKAFASCKAPSPKLNTSVAANKPVFVDLKVERCAPDIFSSVCEAYTGLDRYVYKSALSEDGPTCQAAADKAYNASQNAVVSEEDKKYENDEWKPMDDTYGTLFQPWNYHDFSKCLPNFLAALCHLGSEEFLSKGVKIPFLTNADPPTVPAVWPMLSHADLLSTLVNCVELSSDLPEGLQSGTKKTWGDYTDKAEREKLLVAEHIGTVNWVHNWAVPGQWFECDGVTTLRGDEGGDCSKYLSNPHDEGDQILLNLLASPTNGVKVNGILENNVYNASCNLLEDVLNNGPCVYGKDTYDAVSACTGDCAYWFGSTEGMEAYVNAQMAPLGMNVTDLSSCSKVTAAGKWATNAGKCTDVNKMVYASSFPGAVQQYVDAFFPVMNATLKDTALATAAAADFVKTNATMMAEISAVVWAGVWAGEAQCQGCLFLEPCLTGGSGYKIQKKETDATTGKVTWFGGNNTGGTRMWRESVTLVNRSGLTDAEDSATFVKYNTLMAGREKIYPAGEVASAVSKGTYDATSWAPAAPLSWKVVTIPDSVKAVTGATQCNCPEATKSDGWCKTGLWAPTPYAGAWCNELEVLACEGERSNVKEVTAVTKVSTPAEHGPRAPIKCFLGFVFGVLCQAMGEKSMAGLATVPAMADWCPDGCLEFYQSCAPNNTKEEDAGKWGDAKITKMCSDNKAKLKEGVDAGKIITEDICPDMKLFERFITTVIVVLILLLVCCCCCCIGCCYWKKCLCFGGNKGAVSPS